MSKQYKRKYIVGRQDEDLKGFEFMEIFNKSKRDEEHEKYMKALRVVAFFIVIVLLLMAYRIMGG